MTGWMQDAACHSYPYLNWTDPENAYAASTTIRVCAGCPVRTQCLEFGMADEWATGIYGGQNLRDIRSRNQIIRDLYARGLTDEAIGVRIGWTYSQVRDRRRKLGLYRRRTQPCGTRAGYRRHERQGEVACRPCKEAENEYRRDLRRAAS